MLMINIPAKNQVLRKVNIVERSPEQGDNKMKEGKKVKKTLDREPVILPCNKLECVLKKESIGASLKAMQKLKQNHIVGLKKKKNRNNFKKQI